MTTHLVFGDAHAHPDHNNSRADWLSKLIYDVRPDVVIDLGDTADFPSLSSYDKGKRSFQGRSYARDVASHNDFQDRVWHQYRKNKKRYPKRIRLIGNHEQRIDRALDLHPELQGTVSYDDLQLDQYNDIIVPYNGSSPGVIDVDGVSYAHYFISGVMGRPIGGEHPGYSLVSKKHQSCTQGHTHVFDHCVRTSEHGNNLHGLLTGCFLDYDTDWAGQANKLWYKGCFIKRNVYKGSYDLETISMNALRYEYGG